MPSPVLDQEKALLFSEARFQALFRDIPTMAVTLDSDWKIILANPCCTSQLGYTIDELKGQSVLKLFHEDDRSAVAEELQKCLENPYQVYRLQFRKVHKNGGLLWVKEVVQGVYDLDGVFNVLVVCQDVTELKQLATEIQDARKYTENIVETLIEPLVVLNFDLKILTANHSFYDTFKVSPEETIGNFIYDLGNGQWDIPKLRVLLEEILPQHTVFNGYEVEHHFLDIGHKVILLNARQIFRKDVSSHVILLAMEDITDRKRAEEEIKKLNISLAKRADELEAANKEHESFNHTVAHDLRQPLNLLSSYCQMISKQFGEQLPEECMGYVQNAYKATLRMDGLIGALLNFSHMSRIEPQRDRVDLSTLAQEVSQSLNLAEPERTVEFRIADAIVANGDANLLLAVLNNLIGNAWKYTSIREKAVIEFGVRDIDGVPTYFVKDNGAGFNMADAPKLFTPFQRLSGAEKHAGFGIGFATVERIIRRHGGKVWAEGELGKGACIYFTLPVN
jgi:PAS domain S-box-containing protein